MNQQELIAHHEKRLARVIAMHNPKKANSELDREKCLAYIAHAEKELIAVKNGRKW